MESQECKAPEVGETQSAESDKAKRGRKPKADKEPAGPTGPVWATHCWHDGKEYKPGEKCEFKGKVLERLMAHGTVKS